MHCLEGVLERITYYNEETLFLVARLRLEENVPATIIGNMPRFNVGERLKVEGDWQLHKDFGRQFKVSKYEVIVPHNEKGIRRFLGSGLIRGIGPSTADRLVDYFGLETLSIMEKEPHRLREVPGIGEKKAVRITASFRERLGIMNVMTYLQSYGVGIGTAARIYRKYGDDTIARVSENPYRLAEDVFGIGFKTADKIALELGLPADSPYRVRAVLLYLVNSAQEDGHVYLPREVLLEKAKELLETEGSIPSGEAAVKQLLKLADDGHLVMEDLDGECAVYSAALFYAERYIAERLRQIAVCLHPAPAAEFCCPEESGTRLTPAQRTAVELAWREGLLVVTGGPGTGKTTTIRSLLALFQAQGLEVMLSAPTGRAAKRMTEATGREAKTIHRLLEYTQNEGEGFSFARNEDRPLTAHAVIVDEVSMVDLPLFYNLLKAIPPGCRLILVGDRDQLPSVGPGNILRDIISSRSIPVVVLDRIFRQAEESAIITNAHLVNRGRMPQFGSNSHDFFFIHENDPDKILAAILELCGSRLPRYTNKDAITDIQVLSPMRRSILGVDNLNVHLREKLNPPAPHKTEIKCRGVLYRLGDKVMQIRNNYQKEVYNGDIGKISFINHDDGELTVTYPDIGGAREVLYDQADLEELVLSYAISVHKSQGSEYPVVILPVVTQHYILLQKNLLYTAITRAKELVVLIGTEKALSIAVRNDKVAARYTRLAVRI